MFVKVIKTFTYHDKTVISFPIAWNFIFIVNGINRARYLFLLNSRRGRQLTEQTDKR